MNVMGSFLKEKSDKEKKKRKRRGIQGHENINDYLLVAQCEELSFRLSLLKLIIPRVFPCFFVYFATAVINTLSYTVRSSRRTSKGPLVLPFSSCYMFMYLKDWK